MISLFSLFSAVVKKEKTAAVISVRAAQSHTEAKVCCGFALKEKGVYERQDSSATLRKERPILT